MYVYNNNMCESLSKPKTMLKMVWILDQSTSLVLTSILDLVLKSSIRTNHNQSDAPFIFEYESLSKEMIRFHVQMLIHQ